MKTGIIGARGVGKSTVFHALTGLAPMAGQSEGRNRARPGQIKVADERLDFLERTYGSKKRVEVELTVLDFAPNPKEQKEGAALDPSLLPLIRDLDALLIVIPEFAGNQAALPSALAAIEARAGIRRSRPGRAPPRAPGQGAQPGLRIRARGARDVASSGWRRASRCVRSR